MSKQQYVKQTLTLPSQLPLFNYNINFQGLRKIIEDIGVNTVRNQQEISSLTEQLNLKFNTDKFNTFQTTINESLVLGIKTNQFIKQIQRKQNPLNKKPKTHTEHFSQKVQYIFDVVEYLMNKTADIEQKIVIDQKKADNKFIQSFRRIDDKVELTLNSFSKTINEYFEQNNKNLTSTQSQLNIFKNSTQTSFANLRTDIINKIGKKQLSNAIQGSQQTVKKQLSSMLSTDQMKRMATLNQYSTKLKQNEKDIQIFTKFIKQQMQQLNSKVNKSFLSSTFEIQKHKIYDKLSQYRSSIDSLNKRNIEFQDFRKQIYSLNQKNKQNFINLQQDIANLNQKGGNFKKLENIGSVIESLDPHLICEVSNVVKLHQKQIQRLQKSILQFQKDFNLKGGKDSNKVQINNGQNSETMSKMIKQYLTNMDFENRVRKVEKDVHELNKKNDLVNQLDKKVHLMMREMDIGMIMKQIKKKCDQQTTMKDIKILDGKLQKMFDFYRTIRKQFEQFVKKTSNRTVKQSTENVSMTTKKLYPPNCISCNPSIPNSRRSFSRNKANYSFEDSGEFLHSTSYLKNKK